MSDGGGYSVNSEASNGADAGSMFGDSRLQITGPILNFGGGTVNPGGLENGGDTRGLPPSPGYQLVPGSGYDGRFSSYAPAAQTVGYYPGTNQPVLFDTYNTGPLSGISGLAIAGLLIAAVGGFVLLKRAG